MNVTPLHRNVQPVPSRPPPHNFEAEQALLGALLVDNAVFNKVSDFLRPDHFADPLHGRIFQACQGLIERNQVANPITLKPFFDSEEVLIANGGAAYFARLAAASGSIIDAADYGRQILELHRRREFLDIGQAIVISAHDPGDRDVPTLVAEAESMLGNVLEAGNATDRLRDGRQSIDGALTRIEEAAREAMLPEAERNRRRIITGLRGLDDKLRISRGDLVFIAGATSMGKSALADNIAEANEANGVGTAVFAMEMNSDQWATRRLARHTGLSSRRIADGLLDQNEMARLMHASQRLEKRPHFINDQPGVSVAQVRTLLRKLKRQHDIGLCIIDYLQLMSAEGTKAAGTRAEELGRMTRSLKATAQELNIALIVASQVNRGVDARDEKRPTLGDLRESGSIEQDANTVLFVYREEYYLGRGKPVGRNGKAPSYDDEMEHLRRLESARGKGEIIIAKQREGEAPITVHCRWDGVRTRFYDGGPE